MKNENKSTNFIRVGSQLPNRARMEYTTQADYENKEEFYETPYGETLTEQDQTLPIPEIMKRAMQGIKPQQGEPLYAETDDFDEIDILKTSQSDLVDRAQLKTTLSARLKELESEAGTAPSPVESEVKKMEPAE